MRALILCVALAGCTAAQKATLSADAHELGSQMVSCVDAEASTAFGQAVTDVGQLAAGGQVTTASLEAVAVKDGLAVAVCAVEDLVSDAAKALAAPPDGGTSIAVADCKRFWALHVGAKAFLAIDPHLPKS